MEQVETVTLINNSMISAIDKLKVADGDNLIFYFRTDGNGNPRMPLDEIKKCYDFIQNFLNQNFNNVDFMMIPDGIRYDNGDSNR